MPAEGALDNQERNGENRRRPNNDTVTASTAGATIFNDEHGLRSHASSTTMAAMIFRGDPRSGPLGRYAHLAVLLCWTGTVSLQALLGASPVAATHDVEA